MTIDEFLSRYEDLIDYHQALISGSVYQNANSKFAYNSELRYDVGAEFIKDFRTLDDADQAFLMLKLSDIITNETFK